MKELSVKNLEQIRAANALAAAPGIGSGKQGGGNVAKKFPNYVRNNGILGAAAFAREDQGGYMHVMNAIILHLSSPHIDIVKAKNLDEFIKELSEKDSYTLIKATDEAMAYLNYLRRFAD